MKFLKKLDHIGFAVNDIESTARRYIESGWTMSEIYEETIQKARIAFLTKEGFPKIELVSPGNYDHSPVDTILKRSGVAPYHLCYVVENVMEAMEALYEEGFMPIFMPVESIAMGNRKICYLQSLQIGTIEIVEE